MKRRSKSSKETTRMCRGCRKKIPISEYGEWYCKKCDTPNSTQYCRICEERVECTPFADQHCHGCEKAGGFFESRKRKVLKGEKRGLTEDEQKEVEASMPEGIRHLNTCSASVYE